MGWLVGYALVSMAVSTVLVHIYDEFVSGLRGVSHVARTGLFVGTWTAITTSLGMRDFNKRVKQLRKSNREVIDRLEAPSHNKRR